MLKWAFILWGVHHLDYPLFRQFGAFVLLGVFADVLFLFTIGLGMLFSCSAPNAASWPSGPASSSS